MKGAKDKPIPHEPEVIACEICLREIPSSVAKSAECPDYVHHFCGLECLGQWQRLQEVGEREKAESRP